MPSDIAAATDHTGGSWGWDMKPPAYAMLQSDICQLQCDIILVWLWHHIWWEESQYCVPLAHFQITLNKL